MLKQIKKFNETLIQDKKKATKALITLEIISIILLILSSGDEVWPFIKAGSLLENILCFELLKNSIIYNLSLGMVVSGIFYYFVSYLNNERRESALRPLLQNKIQTVVMRMEYVILDYTGIPRESLSDLTEDDIKIAGARDPKAAIIDEMSRRGLEKRFEIEGEIYKETVGSRIANSWFLGLDAFKELEEYSLIYSDPKLIKLVKNSFYLEATKWMRGILTANNNDLMAWSTNATVALRLGNCLIKYCKENEIEINSSLENNL